MNNDSPLDIVQSNEIIQLLENTEALDFLERHYHEQPEKLALKFRGRTGFSLSKLTQLLQLYRKAELKIPLWAEKRCALHQKSYEQCTHHEVARFKSKLFSGESMLDMTSGLGVDAYYFSKHFDHVHCLEADPQTFTMSRFNAPRLGANNITIENISAEDYTFKKSFDLIYMDPDRRPEEEIVRKQVEEYSPNVFDMEDILTKHAQQVLIKLSPMVDLHYLHHKFSHLSRIYVIAYRNEVKEVLAVLQKHPSDTVEHTAVDLAPEQVQLLEGVSHATQFNIPTIASGKYLIEPSRAIIKAGLTNQFALKYGLSQLSKESLYFFTDALPSDLQGRAFEILHTFDFSWKDISKFLKSHKIKAINIAQRNFFNDVNSIRKQLKIKAGGNDFLFFSTDEAGAAVCYYAKPLKRN